jgi:peptidoglycan/xylan/chitin deacetylase (PgdA/CDA1 family)
MEKGYFVISLDFEIYWGVRDVVTLNQYKANLLGVRKAIPAMLALFDKYNINATFATVGFLFFNDKEELLKGLPGKKPAYQNANLSPYGGHFNLVGENEEVDPMHFAPSLIKEIQQHGQEIGCHTFSHYYCLEKGQTVETFTEDLRAAKKIAEQQNISLKSLVFPRNQFNNEYLQACRNEGFTSYRGNENSWVYKPHPQKSENFLWRMIRITDAYINLTGHHCFAADKNKELPINIPSSRFLRPYSKKLSMLDALRLRRITNSMTHAAKNNLSYHLWWHPHNFGINLKENIAFLEKIMIHYTKLSEKYKFTSVSMTQLADLLINENGK